MTVALQQTPDHLPTYVGRPTSTSPTIILLLLLSLRLWLGNFELALQAILIFTDINSQRNHITPVEVLQGLNQQ